MTDEVASAGNNDSQNNGPWDKISRAVVLEFLEMHLAYIRTALQTFSSVPWESLPDSMKNNYEYFKDCERCIRWLIDMANKMEEWR